MAAVLDLDFLLNPSPAESPAVVLDQADRATDRAEDQTEENQQCRNTLAFPERGKADPALRAPAEDPEEARLFGVLRRYQQEREQAQEVYKKYQANIRQAAHLKTQVLKGLQLGQDPGRLLMLACQAIGLMTGDELFIRLTEETFIAVHGKGFGNPAALAYQLEETQARLQRLKEAARREPKENQAGPDYKRLGQAIKAHEGEASRLQGLIDIENRKSAEG